MKIIRNHLICFFLWILLSLPPVHLTAVFADENQKGRDILDLKACIVLAVQSDPEVNRAKDQATIGELLKSEAFKAMVLPRIDLETTYGPKLDYFGRPVFPDSESLYDSKVLFDKPLYKGGALKAQYEIGKKEIRRRLKDQPDRFTPHFRLAFEHLIRAE